MAAYEILLKIDIEHAYSSALLANYETDLEPVDRGLCHEIVLGVLRRKLTLDRYIDIFTNGRKLDIEIRNILRIGLFQLYFLDRIPNHAAVNESVGLSQRARKSSARGLVNAVLRTAIRETPSLLFEDEIERMSIETSHPRWLIEHWSKSLDADSVERLASSNNETPQIAFRRTIKGKEIKLPHDVVESNAVPGCFIAKSFSAELREFADRGDIYFQDEASQMVAAAIDPQRGDRFLDVCASPGGKTTAVAFAISEPRGMRIVAGDIIWRRVVLLKETCSKQGANFIQIVQYDAAEALPFADESFDCVLVDAPCTGTGTISHNPEIRYFVKPDDFSTMQKVQLAILRNAAKLVQPGGRLIYSTCSIEREENETVCETFMSITSGWTKMKPSVPEAFWTVDGYARTFPYRDRMDGFFVATFQRT